VEYKYFNLPKHSDYYVYHIQKIVHFTRTIFSLILKTGIIFLNINKMVFFLWREGVIVPVGAKF